MLVVKIMRIRPLAADRKLSRGLFDQLAEQIRSGRIAPGARLPTEQALTRAARVSRTVVREAVAALRAEQDKDLQAFGVKFDVYYLESSLYTDGKVDEAVRMLVDKGHTFEKDGALWAAGYKLAKEDLDVHPGKTYALTGVVTEDEKGALTLTLTKALPPP